MRAVLAVVFFVFLELCAHGPETKPLTGFRLEVLPDDAELTVDGQALGPVGQLALEEGVLKLDPGVHQVSLKRKGYQTWRAEVALGSTVEPLKVNLVKR